MKTQVKFFTLLLPGRSHVAYGSTTSPKLTAKRSIGAMIESRLSARRTILACLGLLLFTLSHSQNLPSPPPSVPGLSEGWTPLATYRETTEAFYALPAGKTILDYNDDEKIIMEQSFSDEQVLISWDESVGGIKSITVLDPSRQFRPEVYAYKQMVVLPNEVRFLDEDGSVLYATSIGENRDEDDPEPLDPADFTLPERLGFFDARYIGQDDRFQQFEGDGYFLEIDEAMGLAYVTYFDDEGNAAEEVTILLDFSNPDRNLPEFEMSVIPEKLPSGDCVFRVEMTSYTDYRDFTLEEEEETIQPRSDMSDNHFEDIKVWPNPASNKIYINVEASGEVMTDVWMMGLDGKLVLREQLSGTGVHGLNIQNIPAGTYVLRAQFDGFTNTQKIVIQ